MRNLPPVTRALLIANVVVYGLQALLGPQLLVDFALWPLGGPALMRDGAGVVEIGFEPWQLVTYAFLHGGLAHLALNLFAMYMFGEAIERTLGPVHYAIYYFVCVVGAAAAQLIALGPQDASGDFFPTVGASGGVYGLLLAFGVLFPRQTVMPLFPPIPMPAWLFVTLFGLLELYLGFSQAQSKIAHFAHLGGMVVGFVLLQYWRGKLPIKPKRRLMR